jgi:hypothetical protein
MKMRKVTRENGEYIEAASLYVIDGANGIYSFNELVSRFGERLYIFVGKVETGEKYEKFEDYLKKEALSNPEERPRTIETIFHPDNEDFMDNIVDFENQLYVKDDTGIYYSVSSESEGIYFIHPDAEYDEITERYYFVESRVEKAKETLKELDKFYRENPAGSLGYYVSSDLEEIETNPDSGRSKETIEAIERGTYLE